MAKLRTGGLAVPITIAGASALIVLLIGFLVRDHPTEPQVWSEVVATLLDGDFQAAKERVDAGHGLKKRDAGFLLGVIHLSEFTDLYDVDVARDHLESAARQGSDKARFLMALHLAKFETDAERSEVRNDLDRALHLLSKIKNPQTHSATYLRTFLLVALRDKRPALAEAVRLTEEPGLPLASWVAALAYRTGIAEPTSYNSIMAGLRDDAANGRAQSQYFLAIELVGEFCKRHTKPGAPAALLSEGLKWVTIAAKQGSGPAQNLLRWCKRSNPETLIKKANSEAEVWFAAQLESDMTLLFRAAVWCLEQKTDGQRACVLQAIEHDEKCRDPWQLVLEVGDLRSTGLYDSCRRFYSERSKGAAS